MPTELVVEHRGSYLQQLVGFLIWPSHLLSFDESLGHHLVDRGLDEAAGDRFTVTIPIAVVDDEVLVVVEVCLALLDLRLEFGVRRAVRQWLDIPAERVKALQRPMRTAVP